MSRKVINVVNTTAIGGLILPLHWNVESNIGSLSQQETEAVLGMPISVFFANLKKNMFC